MKFVVTGSLGHVGRPLTEELVQRGHDVVVVSSNAERRAEIEALGATAAIGVLQDAQFLSATLSGSQALFLLVGGGKALADPDFDLDAHFRRIGEACALALTASGVTRLVYLSSVGAELASGTGLLRLHHAMEAFLNNLSLAVTFLRPTGFFTNLLGYIPAIKTSGQISAGFGDLPDPWVSPIDIAAAAAQELEALVAGGAQVGERKILYVASEELTGQQIATIVGTAVGKPELKWVIVSSEQLKQRMLAGGMPPSVAAAMTEMQATQRSGALSRDYYRHRPVLGRVKLADFAKEFAAEYLKS